MVVAVLLVVWMVVETRLIVVREVVVESGVNDVSGVGGKIESEEYEVCDEFGRRFASEKAAREAGLLEAQFGATYCQYLDDEPETEVSEVAGVGESEVVRESGGVDAGVSADTSAGTGMSIDAERVSGEIGEVDGADGASAEVPASATDVEATEPAQEGQSWWKPALGTSWFWQLDGKLNLEPDAEVFDIDLEDTSKEQIEVLHKMGKKVICYFSAGSYESWRKDAGLFPKSVFGKKLDDWEGERWLDVSRFGKFAGVMLARLDAAKEKGCDGVEPDNVDGFLNDTGFEISYKDQLRYNRWLSKEARKRGLAVGLKNDLEQVKDLVDYFDFVINEQCFEYDECDKLLPFKEADKAVFGVEYNVDKKDFCPQANALKFSWLKANYELDGKFDPCW